MLDVKFYPSIPDLQKELDAIKQGLGDRGLMAGLVAGSKPIRKSVSAAAPVGDDGALAKSIGFRRLNKTQRSNLKVRSGVVAIYVGPTRKTAEWVRTGSGTYAKKKRSQQYKANWFENTGVKPHRIESAGAGKGKRSPLKLPGGRFRASAQHPGMKKSPFMERGMNAAGSGFEKEFHQGVVKYLEQQRAKRNSR